METVDIETVGIQPIDEDCAITPDDFYQRLTSQHTSESKLDQLINQPIPDSDTAVWQLWQSLTPQQEQQQLTDLQRELASLGDLIYNARKANSPNLPALLQHRQQIRQQRLQELIDTNGSTSTISQIRRQLNQPIA